jgi:hypothetical protein
MEMDLIDNLHLLSTVSINIPLEKSSINRLIYIENYHYMEDFLDADSFLLQDELLKANDNKIAIILKNLTTAIKTNCNNDIDLNNLSSISEFQYSYQTNLDEKSISKMYKITSKFPLEDDLFKKYWLKNFIEDCAKIVKIITTILNKEQFYNDDNIIEKQKKSALILFMDKMRDVSSLDHTPFSELYPWYFEEFTTNLKDEIISNLTLLNDAKFDLYLNWLRNKIESDFVYDPEACIIDRWIKEFNLIESEFPYNFNQEVSNLISSFNDTTLKPDEARKVRMIQLEFHWYAVYLEYKKIISFITELTTNKSTEKLIPGDTKPTNPYPRIFTSIKAFEKFQNLLDEFGNGSENLANYSFVFHRMKRDKLIFDDFQQTQFVFFLLDFDINISRIKPKSQLGNNDLREGIYNRI